MEELLKKTTELREKVKQYGDQIRALLGIIPKDLDPRSDCFFMIHQHLTLTLELLSHYYSTWSKLSNDVNSQERDRMQRENGERCMMILRWLFIASLSSMEYSAKASVASYGEGSPAKSLIKVKRGQYVYLSNIVYNSNDLNLIDDNEYDDWQNLIFLRNCVVHNNGVSDHDKTFIIAGTKVEARTGKMLQGKLDFFAIITEAAIERYFTWVKALIKEYRG